MQGNPSNNSGLGHSLGELVSYQYEIRVWVSEGTCIEAVLAGTTL